MQEFIWGRVSGGEDARRGARKEKLPMRLLTAFRLAIVRCIRPSARPATHRLEAAHV